MTAGPWERGVCIDCGYPYDWCPECGCCCICECWLPPPIDRDPRFTLWRDEYGQGVKGPVDTIQARDGLL